MAQLRREGIKLKLLLINAISTNAPDRLHPPLGLAYLAASLRKEFGKEIECKIIDSNMASEIQLFYPDVVGITSVSKNYNIAKGYAAIAKHYNIPVIIGGVHISALPETMTDNMDIAVIGEGEETIAELLSSFLETKHFGKYIKNTAYKINNDLQITLSRDLIKPLDNIPFPSRDLLTIGKHTLMLTSRGCPYKCAFCSTSRHTRNQVRYHSAEYVVAEMEMIYREYKPEYITIYDDLFAMDTKRVIEIQQRMAAKNLIGKFSLAINTRSNFVTDELAEVLQGMNVKVVAIGVESGCQKTLDYLKSGGITVEDNARAVRIIKKHHMIPYCVFIIGSPDEDMESVLQTVEFIENNKIDHYDINVLTAYPGTPVWDYALSRGIVSNGMDWSKLDFTVNPDQIILSEKLSRQDLDDILKRLDDRKKRKLLKRKIMNVIK
ncbi:hypothetical protein LCGC14_1888360, partial [marine sediment metagenome]